MKINEKCIRSQVIKVNTTNTFLMQCQNVILNWIHLQAFLKNILKPGLTVTAVTLNTDPNLVLKIDCSIYLTKVRHYWNRKYI